MIDHSAHSRDRVGFLCALFLAIICGSPAANAFTLEDGSIAPVGSSNAFGIQGDPLRVWTDEFLRVWVYREHPDLRTTAFLAQYNTYYRTLLRVTKDTQTEVAGDHREDAFRFTPVSIGVDPANRTPGIITTVTTDGGNLRIVHKITYVSGDSFLRHEWTVTNLSSSTYTNVALRYGGDTAFGIPAEAKGYYSGNTKVLYCANADPTVFGTMGMQAASGTAFDRYIEGYAPTVESALLSANDLPSLVNVDKIAQADSDYADNGMAVEWGNYTLGSNGSFSATLYERWTLPGNVQVFAPADFTAEAGTSQTITFDVHNLAATSQDVALGLIAPEGWIESSPSTPITILSDTISPVAADILFPLNYSGSGQIELTATGTGSPQSAQVVIDVATFTTGLPSGSDLPLSTATRTIYTGINPSTQQGIDSVIATLTGRSPLVARAFIWDRQLSQYVDFATIPHPSQDLRVSTGIFIATRVPLAYDLNGSPTNAPYSLTLETATSSWAFAGLPPVELDQSTVQTEFIWPSSFLITHSEYDGYAGSSYEVTESSSPYTLAQLMGDAQGSSVPLWWNGSAYVPAPNSTLESGKAYWFRNNAVQGSIIITVQTAAQRAQQQQQALRAGSAPLNLTSSSSSGLAAGLRAPTAPPPPPGGASGGTSGGDGSSASTGGGGGGCGAGSGLSLFGLLLSLIGLRFLAGRR